MSLGKGKYDDECTLVRERTNAMTAIVIIEGGDKGQGFSCQTIDPLVQVRLPQILRRVADDIEQSLHGAQV